MHNRNTLIVQNRIQKKKTQKCQHIGIVDVELGRGVLLDSIFSYRDSTYTYIDTIDSLILAGNHTRSSHTCA